MPTAHDSEVGVPPEIAGLTDAVGSPGLTGLLGDGETLKGQLATVREPAPTIGRIVRYRAYGTPGGEYAPGALRAAIITEIDRPDDTESPIGLCVLNPTGIFFNQHVTKGHAPGQWSWPSHGVAIPMESST